MFIYFLFLCLLESPYAKYRKSSILINHDSRKIIICFVVAGCNDQGVYFYIRPYYLYQGYFSAYTFSRGKNVYLDHVLIKKSTYIIVNSVSYDSMYIYADVQNYDDIPLTYILFIE